VVGSERRFTVELHMNTAKNVQLSKQKEKNDKQQLISNTKKIFIQLRFM